MDRGGNPPRVREAAVVSDLFWECAEGRFQFAHCTLRLLVLSWPYGQTFSLTSGAPRFAGNGGYMISAITAGIGLVANWLDGEAKVKAARAERESKALTSEANWDEVQANKAGWTRDYLTLIISIPMVLAFVPGAKGFVLEGFAALQEMPEWYQYLLGAVFAANFGIKKLADWRAKRL